VSGGGSGVSGGGSGVSVQKHGASVGVSAGGLVGGGEVGVFGSTGIGVFVGRGGTLVGKDDGGLVEVGKTIIRVRVGVGELVTVEVGVNVKVGLGVSVGMYCTNAWAVSAAAVFRLEKAWLTRSPGATAMGSSRLESVRATADVAQNMPKPRMPAAKIQSKPA
jgi:hypothetical protein